jgi:hypothetical protein
MDGWMDGWIYGSCIIFIPRGGACFPGREVPISSSASLPGCPALMFLWLALAGSMISVPVCPGASLLSLSVLEAPGEEGRDEGEKKEDD